MSPFTIDTEFDQLPNYSPVCSLCRHLRNDGDGRTCNAFPDRIPDVIWMGRHKHRQAYPGDHGIRFEPVPDPTPVQRVVQGVRGLLRGLHLLEDERP